MTNEIGDATVIELGTLTPKPWTVSVDDALTECVRYAFGRLDGEDGPYRFAYWSYDCPPRTGLITASELALAATLNARMSNADLARAYSVADDVNRALRTIPPAARFWTDVDPLDLRSDETPVTPVGLAMTEAWRLLTDLSGLRVARVHKILHRVRPEVFPLLDRETRELLRPSDSPHEGYPGNVGLWASVHSDLTACPGAWLRLETAFAAEAGQRGGIAVPLSRLRLHDILVWLEAVRRRGASVAPNGTGD